MRSARRRTPARLAPLPAMLAAAGLLQSLGATPAAAACAPTLAPASGQSVQCDGAVVNQSVEAAAGSQNVTITVAPGALFSTNATRALSVDDRSRIVNEGTIQMAGGAGASRGAMVGFGDNNQLINRGSITTSGSGVRGISVPNVGSTGTLVDNSGSIRTQGASAHGIAINGPGNRVQNSGAITVNGTDAKGVYLQGGSPAANVLVNGGTIHARGASSNGIFGPDGVHVNTTNANGFHARVENLPGGRILSDHSYALRGQNGNDTFINAGYLQGHRRGRPRHGRLHGPQGTGTLILRTGSAIAGLADGGGAASHAYLEGSGTVDNRFANFRTLTMRGADWRWTSDAAFTESVDLRTGTFFLAGTLASPANRLAAGAVLAGTGTLAGALRNAGEIRPGPNDGSGYGALTVRGDYTGAGGALRVNTVLAGDGAASDRLVIDGGHAGGSTPVTVVNRGGQGALTAADGILVVQAINGASSDAGAFSLAAPSTPAHTSTGCTAAAPRAPRRTAGTCARGPIWSRTNWPAALPKPRRSPTTSAGAPASGRASRTRRCTGPRWRCTAAFPCWRGAWAWPSWAPSTNGRATRRCWRATANASRPGRAPMAATASRRSTAMRNPASTPAWPACNWGRTSTAACARTADSTASGCSAAMARRAATPTARPAASATPLPAG